jgi:membrane-bound lytic murein transglycosylase A
MRLSRLAPVVAALLWLAACATSPGPAPGAPGPGPGVGPGAGPVDPGPTPWTPGPPSPAFAALPGWADEDHAAALMAYTQTCHVRGEQTARSVCSDARALTARGPVDRATARQFFEARFIPQGGDAEGLLTSYFAPEYEARRQPDGGFTAAVLGPPADLVRTAGPDGRPLYRQAVSGGAPRPYPDRATIDASIGYGGMGAPLGWMRPEDLFFMQIQGSGYLTFEDGGRARAAYAADNGLGFVGIARPMAEEGLLPRNGTSGEAIRRWLSANRGAEAQRVMNLNPRYIFFSIQPDDGGDPAGAAGVPLPARRAIAVDPSHWSYGELVWIDAQGAGLVGARASYRGLVMALDTGSAIRGPVRADFYMGRGPAAGDEAGTVRHPLRMWRLVPR